MLPWVEKYKEHFGVKELPSSIYETSERRDWIVSEEDAERINSKYGAGTVKVGEKGTYLPIPETIEKAWERLVKLDAQKSLEWDQGNFLLKYGKPQLIFIEERLKVIDEFITAAEKESPLVAFESQNRDGTYKNYLHEYLRLKYGYYQLKFCPSGISNLCVRVYSEYFLFREWLIELKRQLDPESNNIKLPSINSENPNNNKTAYTLDVTSIEGLSMFLTFVANDYAQFLRYQVEGQVPNPKEPTPEYVKRIQNSIIKSSSVYIEVEKQFEKNPIYYSNQINQIWFIANYLKTEIQPHEKDPKDWNGWDRISTFIWQYARPYNELVERRKAEISGLSENTNNLKSTKKNLFNLMPIEEVQEFFLPFIIEKSNNGKTFLTLEQLEAFIDRAFCGNQEISKQTFNSGPGEKLFLQSLFYAFYCDSLKLGYDDGRLRDKYIKLLTDNFNNWEFEETKANFNKKPARKWKSLL